MEVLEFDPSRRDGLEIARHVECRAILICVPYGTHLNVKLQTRSLRARAPLRREICFKFDSELAASRVISSLGM